MNSRSPNALMTDLLAILKKPVAFFVYDRFTKHYSEKANTELKKVLKANPHAKQAQKENSDVFKKRDLFVEKIDIHGLLLLIEHRWTEVFANRYPEIMREAAASLLESRHQVAHQKPLTIEDLQKVVQTAKILLNKMKTTSAKNAIKKIRQLLRHDYCY